MVGDLMREQVGKLSCLKRPGDRPGYNMVLLHGFGADASDLFPLADFLDPDGDWNFYFPDAPLEVPIGPQWTGRGWFPISVRDLEVGIDFTQIRPPGLNESAQLIGDLIFHLNSEKLILGGFSQGGMVATEVALDQPEALQGLVLMSTGLLDEANWKKRASELKGKRILQSHGTQDAVLPFSAGQRLCEVLKTAGADVEWISFSGGHEIPVQVLKRISSFLKTCS